MQSTIVLAEDSKTVRRMVEIALERHPFTLSVAEDGESALGAVRNQRPALVLADTALAGIDGYELTRRIKADVATSGVKVLLLAGFHQRLDESRARQVGADGHVSKPFLTQDLLDAIYKVTTGDVAPDSDLFRNQAPKAPLARKPLPPKTPAAATAQAPAAAPAAPAVQANPFEGAESTRPFQRPEEPARAEPRAVETPAPVVHSGPVTIDDEALKQAVALVARDVIERIVWEVVPPIAEALLKEEIARIVRERLAQD